MNDDPFFGELAGTNGAAWKKSLRLAGAFCLFSLVFVGTSLLAAGPAPVSPRERIPIDDDWRFIKGDPTNCTVSLLYDTRRTPAVRRFAAEADGNPALNQSVTTNESTNVTAVIKQWILPTSNEFIKDPLRKFVRPQGNPGDGVAYVQPGFDDRSWQKVTLPHDWAIAGPFIRSGGGGMGRLPAAGVGWYRKELNLPATDSDKSIFLDVDGAMSYAVVWLNGQCVGGWPYGYASWRVDLTPYVKPGGTNELAIRLDNPPNSSRWYPGAGIYRGGFCVVSQRRFESDGGQRFKTRRKCQCVHANFSTGCKRSEDRRCRGGYCAGKFENSGRLKRGRGRHWNSC
jgi:beta-galactosidase